MSTATNTAWLDRLVHDLRGPLAPLQTAIYLLGRDDLDAAKRTELLAMLDRQTRRLSAMLEELDDWTRIPRLATPVRGERCDLALLLEYALAAANMAGTPVEGDSALVEVKGDQQRLTQLLRSLLGHASRDGCLPQVVLSNDAHCARVEVRKAGGAADAAALAKLFDQPETSPYDEGLGLRMMLARVIARAHGGELTAQVEGGGVVMRLELPLAPSD